MLMQTIFKVSDNSGVKYVKCIKLLGGFKKQSTKLGQRVVVSVSKVKSVRRKYKVLKGDILHGIIVSSKKHITRKNGVLMSYKVNSVVLIKDKKLIGTRILIPLIKEFRYTKYMKLISLSIGTI